MTPTPANTTSEVNAGRIAGVFGLRGELKLVASRIGEDALAPDVDVRAALADGSSRTVRVHALRRRQGRPLLHFDGVDDANAAEAFGGATLWIARDHVALARDEFFDDDLAGCVLVDAAGAELGTVRAVEHYPAQDMLVVERGDTRALVPMVRAFVRTVDVRAKRITVDVPAGLIDAAEADEA